MFFIHKTIAVLRDCVHKLEKREYYQPRNPYCHIKIVAKHSLFKSYAPKAVIQL